MMTTLPRAAAIYARISEDRTGQALGVKRQIADCEALAERRGWTVAQLYVDDDLSAFNGKPRPAYQQLLADLTDGLVDAVITYHLDRLHRQPKELEAFAEVCDAARVTHVATVQGDVNLGSDDGLFVARIMGAVAAQESAAKSRRVRRKMDELAQAGRPHGGPTRPFGYAEDKVTVVADEAEVIRQLAGRLLAGESLNSLTNWLTDSPLTTVSGKERWHTSTVRQLLRSGRISGQREHAGEIVGPAAWPAIITPQQTDQIRALLDDPARRTTRTARRYLLAGMLHCQRCGGPMHSHPRNRERRYGCRKDANFTGCGGTYIVADPLEQLITQAVLYRLDTPEMAAALAGELAHDEQAAALAEQVAAEQAQLGELAGLYGERHITAAEWRAARKPIETRLKQAKGRLGRLRRTTVLDGLVGAGSTLRTEWQTLNLDRQRAIVAAVLDHAVIGPGSPSRFTADRVEPVWRL
jgi:site-specific DNA recombinase